MNLKQIWNQLHRNTPAPIEFEEFEELMNDWAWNELERQRGSISGNIYNPRTERPVDGF